jgi:hypothetical protein
MARLTKVVNGKRREMSPEEEAEIRAEWAANEERAKNRPPREEQVLAKDLMAQSLIKVIAEETGKSEEEITTRVKALYKSKLPPGVV